MYDLPLVGDGLPMHVHAEDTAHITIVATGRIVARGNGWEVEAGPGQLLNFRAGEPHELMALEDNTRIFNIQKKMGGVYGGDGV